MNKKKIYVMRGMPSSGKSFIALKLCKKKEHVFSADDYHTDPKTGEYNWKPENVRQGHIWNHNRVIEAIKSNWSPICIDCTHIKFKELKKLKPIILLGIENDYEIIIKEPDPTWYYYKSAFNSEKLFLRSKLTHNVPLESIKKMIEDYEPNISVEDILKDI